MKHASLLLAAAFLLIGLTTVIVGCGESEAEKAARIAEKNRQDSTHRVDSLAALLKPRKDIYDLAISKVKGKLKAPAGAKFAMVTLDDDTVKIKMRGLDTALVYGEYDSQNGFGVYMHGQYKVALRRDNTGKWVGRSGSDFGDVEVPYSSILDRDQ